MADLHVSALPTNIKARWTAPVINAGLSLLPALHDEYGRWPLEALLDLLDEADLEQSAGLNTRNLFLEFLEIIGESGTAAALLDEAASQGWSLALENLEGADLYIDIPEKLILLDNNGMNHMALSRSAYFTNTMLISLIRALREVWQEKRHGAFDDYTAESVLLLERVRAADNQVVTILVARELRNAGFEPLWRHMLGLPEGTLSHLYAHMLERDPLSQLNGMAAASVFYEWFKADERVAACDHAVLEAFDDMMDAAPGHIFGIKKTGRICIEKLSCLPDRSAYLDGQGGVILGDPRCWGMNDPINQAHFLQIMRDTAATYVENVAFRDASLAWRIFPDYPG